MQYRNTGKECKNTSAAKSYAVYARVHLGFVTTRNFLKSPVFKTEKTSSSKEFGINIPGMI
jgi:hypothetical protein